MNSSFGFESLVGRYFIRADDKGSGPMMKCVGITCDPGDFTVVIYGLDDNGFITSHNTKNVIVVAPPSGPDPKDP